MKTDKLRVAIVGCGLIAPVAHVPAFRMAGAKVVAVCDNDEARAKNLAQDLGAEHYTDPDEMISRSKPDIVDITSPPQTHKDLALLAMKHNCHVLVEKPMCVTLADADEIIEASQASRRKVCVVHNSVFNPVVMRAKESVKRGDIGQLLSVETLVLDQRKTILSRNGHWAHALPLGIFGEVAPHAVYLELEFMENINQVMAMTKKFSAFPWVKADELEVLLRGENILGRLAISINSPRTCVYMSIQGTNGTLSLDTFGMVMIKENSRNLTTLSLAGANLSKSWQWLSGTAKAAVFKMGTRVSYPSHCLLISDFIQSIQEGRDPVVTAKSGREVVRILHMIKENLQENNPEL